MLACGRYVLYPERAGGKDGWRGIKIPYPAIEATRYSIWVGLSTRLSNHPLFPTFSSAATNSSTRIGLLASQPWAADGLSGGDGHVELHRDGQPGLFRSEGAVALGDDLWYLARAGRRLRGCRGKHYFEMSSG